jgi:hydroxypyruvate isomerase
MPKFAANLSMLFTELDFLDRFAAARAAGFDAVEFLFPYAFEPEQIAGRLHRYGLELVLHNFPAGDWNAGERGMACDPRRIGEFRASVELAAEYAVELGVRRLHCLSGKLHPAVPFDRARATFIDNLRFAAGTLAPHGIDVLIEPLNDHDNPGYFLTGSAQAADIIAACGAPNVFMQYDVYHMARMGERLDETLRAQLPLIRHVQVADAPGRHEPGSGGIDFPNLFHLLDELGYDGWIGCEYTPRGATVDGLGWREQLLAALATTPSA